MPASTSLKQARIVGPLALKGSKALKAFSCVVAASALGLARAMAEESDLEEVGLGSTYELEGSIPDNDLGFPDLDASMDGTYDPAIAALLPEVFPCVICLKSHPDSI